MDDLGLVKTVDRFGESVVITVADTSDGRLNACLRQSLRIANGHILRAAVGMVDEPATVDGPSIMKRLIECIENKTRMGSPACPPTDDAASKGIDYERDVNEALPGRHIGEIRKPEHVRRRREEVLVQLLVEAKAWDKPFVSARAGGAYANEADLIVAAVEHVRDGKSEETSPAIAEWHKYLRQVDGYVRTLKNDYSHGLPRAVIVSGEWLVVFKQPVETFLGAARSVDIAVYRRAEFRSRTHKARSQTRRAASLTLARKLSGSLS